MTLLEAGLLTNTLVNISKSITFLLSGPQHHMFLVHFYHSTSNRRDYWFRSKWVTIHNCMCINICPTEEIKRIKKTSFIPEHSVLAEHGFSTLSPPHLEYALPRTKGTVSFYSTTGILLNLYNFLLRCVFCFSVLKDINTMNYSLYPIIDIQQLQNSNDNTRNNKTMWDGWVTGEIQVAFARIAKFPL